MPSSSAAKGPNVPAARCVASYCSFSDSSVAFLELQVAQMHPCSVDLQTQGARRSSRKVCALLALLQEARSADASAMSGKNSGKEKPAVKDRKSSLAGSSFCSRQYKF